MSKFLNAPTRRGAVLFSTLWPFAAATAGEPSPTDALIQRARDGNDAFIAGDMRRWFAIVSPLSDDFTLMSPFGGAPSHGFDGSDAHLDAMATRFRGGEATFELVQSYATRDMVTLVFIERQRTLVGDLPAQDWSLRVTHVYRRRGGRWELVHRHADPLTHDRNLARTAAIARGEG